MIKKPIIVSILIIAVILSGCTEPQESPYVKYQRLEKEYLEQHKPIKEMSSFIGTSGTMSGSFLLIGGSVYGTIDTQHYITLIYQVNINNETYHKSTTIPLEDVDFITIGKNESSYLTIKSIKDDVMFVPENGIPHYENFKLTKIRLYLPEGWQVIGDKK